MFRPASNQILSTLATLLTFGMFGLSGGLLYGACLTDECNGVVFFQTDGTQGSTCYEYEETNARTLRSGLGGGGTEEQYPNTTIKRYNRESCTDCYCSGDGSMRQCTGGTGSRTNETSVPKYYCKPA